jgi:hypothetical protein
VFRGNDILTAGADRSVQVYDVRTWRPRLNWRSPCKYDIIHLLPASSETRSRGVYVCGLDNEILLCDVTGVEKQPVQKKGLKRKIMEAPGDTLDTAPVEQTKAGPSHALLPDSSKLRISHHR